MIMKYPEIPDVFLMVTVVMTGQFFGVNKFF